MTGRARAAEPVRAAVLREVGAPPRVEEVELDAPGPGQVRVRIAAAGVCHSDLSLARGTLRIPALPAVLGHEGAGHVVEVGPAVTGLAAGDPVLLNWSPSCGRCWFCRHGEPYLCEHSDDATHRPYGTLADGTRVHPGLSTGAFATETVVGRHACVPLPADLPMEQAAVLGCAVLTGVGAVLNSARVRPGESVVIFGLGGVGLSALQGARLAGAEPIIAVDPAESRWQLARSLGAAEVLPPGRELGRSVRALTGGRGADHAIECVGRAETVRAAWSVTRRGGRATIVGLGGPDDTVAFSALELPFFARTLAGCMFGSSDPAVDVPVLVEHVRAGRLDLAALVTDTAPLDAVRDAFARMEARQGARTVLLPGSAG
ncbi:MAG: Zn-dependent alcohol dehydrogenase [Mycobacteriales bacterium]